MVAVFVLFTSAFRNVFLTSPVFGPQAALASCGCGNGGKDVCGMGSGCSRAVVRPAPFIPAPARQATVVRKYVTVVEESQPQPSCYTHRAAPRPAPQPCYEPAPRPAPQPCYEPAPAPQPEPCYGEERSVVYQPAVYQPAPLPVKRILVRPAPQPVCRSCLLPAPSCGCQ